MPRTRTELGRDAKVEQILEASAQRLREGGYEALSVVGLARELGVAQNAIYWYFPSKDDLFVATLDRMLREILARKPAARTSPVKRILWFTDQFGALSSLRASMNERARTSPVVAEFVDQLEAHLTRMLSGALRDHVPAAQLPIAVQAFRATVEGTYATGMDPRARRKVLTFALERLMDS
jgi:AcrR family transcriptional regulator